MIGMPDAGVQGTSQRAMFPVTYNKLHPMYNTPLYTVAYTM